MQVVVKKSFDLRVEGTLINLPDNVAESLIEKGFVEKRIEQVEKIEQEQEQEQKQPKKQKTK